MRPAEFAPEAIIQAGQELQATGRNITGFALRQKVGGGNHPEAQADIADYIVNFYNAVWLHSTLGYQSPCQHEQQHTAAH